MAGPGPDSGGISPIGVPYCAPRLRAPRSISDVARATRKDRPVLDSLDVGCRTLAFTGRALKTAERRVAREIDRLQRGYRFKKPVRSLNALKSSTREYGAPPSRNQPVFSDSRRSARSESRVASEGGYPRKATICDRCCIVGTVWPRSQFLTVSG